MPGRPAKPCNYPGCGRLVRDGTSRCEKHPRMQWAKRHDTPKRMTGRRLQEERESLFRRQPICAECAKLGWVGLSSQRDHIVPLSQGGEDTRENTQGLCTEHHDAKSKAEAQAGRQG